MKTTDDVDSLVSSKLPPRFPDHKFAFSESCFRINWLLANCTVRFLQDSRHSVKSALVANGNIQGIVPRFVDSEWNGWDSMWVPKAKKAKLSAADLEEKWCATSYYKVMGSNGSISSRKIVLFFRFTCTREALLNNTGRSFGGVAACITKTST